MTVVLDPSDLGSPGFIEDPYPLYRRLREAGPVHRLGEGETWVLARYDEVARVSGDWRGFTSTADIAGDPVLEQIGPGDLLNEDPPRHDTLRRIVQRAFAARAVAGLETSVRGEVTRLLDPLLERGEGDLAEELAWPLPVATIARVLGLPPDDVPQLTRWVRGLDDAQRDDVVGTLASLRAYLVDALAGTTAEDRVLHAVREAQAGEVVSAKEAVGLCVGLVLAGTATVACLISNALLLLERHAPAMALARHGGLDWRLAVEELLRFESPVQVLPRRASQTARVGGDVIPAGATVLLLLASANRDERRFPDADVLDLARRPKRHVALGAGAHFCLGAALARLEARVALAELFRRIDGYALSGPSVRIPSADVRGLLQLPAALFPAAGGPDA